MNRHESLDPMRIAHHPLFTAREKIELLEELKDGVTRAVDGPSEEEFSPDDIDAAIHEVRDAVRRGAASTRSDA